MSPSIQNTRTIDTKQNTQASLVCCMIHMSKSVYTRLWVIINITQNAVNHTRCSSCCCNLTRIQYVQRQGIVRLVATTIGNRRTSLQSQLSSSLSTNHTLFCKGRYDICYQRIVKAIIIHQEISHLVVLEIPEHTFTQSANRCINGSRKTHGDIITRQHYLIYTIIDIRLIFLYPSQLCCCEITRRVQQMAQAFFCTQLFESFLTIGYCTRVTPDNCRTQCLQILVYTYQTVHLIRNTNSLDLLTFHIGVCHDFLQAKLCIIPPHLRVLLCPTSLNGHDRSFFLRIESCCYTFTRVCIH